MSCTIASNWVSQEYDLLNPCWLCKRSLWDSKLFITLENIMCSTSLDDTLVRHCVSIVHSIPSLRKGWWGVSGWKRATYSSRKVNYSKVSSGMPPSHFVCFRAHQAINCFVLDFCSSKSSLTRHQWLVPTYLRNEPLLEPWDWFAPKLVTKLMTRGEFLIS